MGTNKNNMLRPILISLNLYLLQASQIFVNNRKFDISPKNTNQTKFAVIADTKFGKYGEVFGYGGSDLFVDEQSLDLIFNSLNEVEDLDFVICLGDALNELPEGVESVNIYSSNPDTVETGNQTIYQEQYDSFSRALAGSKHPVLTIPGEREFGSTWESSDVMDRYNLNYGDDYYYFRMNNVLFLSVNDYLFEVEDNNAAQFINNQWQWLYYMLEQSVLDETIEKIVMFVHVPPYHDSVDEDADGQNLSEYVRYQFLSALEVVDVPVEIYAGHTLVESDPESDTLNSNFMEIQKGSLMGRVDNEIGAEFLVGTGGYKVVTFDSAGDSSSQWFGFGDKVV